MKKLAKIAGYVWAAPVTFFGLTYASVFQALRWYKWHGVEGDALVWILDVDRSPAWLIGLWRKWAGHAIGNVIVLSNPNYLTGKTLAHELKHVDQVMRLGVFQPIMYGLNYVAIRIGCTDSDPYLSNPFEIDARRGSGQLVDVEGERKRLSERKG